MLELTLWILLLSATVYIMTLCAKRWELTGSEWVVVGLVLNLLAMVFFGSQIWRVVQELWL